MNRFEISLYLRDRIKTTNQGNCIGCQKLIQWSREKVASHKRSNCSATTSEEKLFFTSSNSVRSNVSMEINSEKKNAIDTALGQLFLETGLPLRVADSYAFKSFVNGLNPNYEAMMPSSKIISSTLLSRQNTSSKPKQDDGKYFKDTRIF